MQNSLLKTLVTQALCTGLALPSYSQQWLFPGESFPEDMGYLPLLATDQDHLRTDADVILPKMDWLLLADQPRMIGTLVNRNRSGLAQNWLRPILDEQNAQIYARIVIGMILQESLYIYNGIENADTNRNEARAFLSFLDAQGALARKTLNETDDSLRLSDFNVGIPSMVQEIRRHWGEVPNPQTYRLSNQLPSLLEPLAIAMTQSGFQHFARGNPKEDLGSRQCSNIQSLPPLASTQSRIQNLRRQSADLQSKLDSLDLERLVLQSQRDELSNLIPRTLFALNRSNACLLRLSDLRRGSVTQTVSSLRATLEAECLSEIESALENRPETWTAFSNMISNENLASPGVMELVAQKNLERIEADIAERKRAILRETASSLGMGDAIESILQTRENLDALIIASQVQVEQLSGRVSEIRSELLRLLDFNDRGTRLRLDPETLSEEDKNWVEKELLLTQFVGNTDLSSLSAERVTQQDIDTFTAIASPAELSRALAINSPLRAPLLRLSSANRQARQSLLTKLRDDLIQEMTKINEDIRNYNLQRNGLNSDLTAPLANAVLAEGQNDPESRVAQIEAEILALNLEKRELESRFTFIREQSDLLDTVYTQLSLHSLGLESEIAESNQKIESQEARLAKLNADIEIETARTNQEQTRILDEVEQLQSSIADYSANDRMGWLLEQDCQLRGQSNSSAHIYLARNSMTDSQSIAESRWGIFQVRTDRFRDQLASGDLLEVRSAIKMGVRAIKDISQQVRSFIFPSRTLSTDCPQYYAGKATGPMGPVRNMRYNLARSVHSAWDLGQDETAVRTGYCQFESVQRPNVARFTSNFRALVDNQPGNLIDQLLPKRGQAKAEDLIERTLIEGLAAATRAITSDTAENVPTVEQISKAMISVMAYDYEQLASELEGRIADQFSRYRFASLAPSAETQGAFVSNPSDVLTIHTLVPQPVYSQPVAEEANLISDLNLEWGDQVEVLKIDLVSGEQVATVAGWVHIRDLRTDQKGYVSVDSLRQGPLEIARGRFVDLSPGAIDCPHPQVVSSLTNFSANDRVVTRFRKGEIPLSETVVPGTFQMSWLNRNRVTPDASPNDTFIACELLTRNSETTGQPLAATANTSHPLRNALGVRILKAQIWTNRAGRTHYIPLESEGGFAQTFILGRNATESRIQLGKTIDANSTPTPWRVID